MKLFYKIRIIYKITKSKLFCINSFCKECGKDVHDFIVDDDVWEQIEPHIKYGHTLCYDCFCEMMQDKVELGVFELILL